MTSTTFKIYGLVFLAYFALISVSYTYYVDWAKGSARVYPITLKISSFQASCLGVVNWAMVSAHILVVT